MKWTRKHAIAAGLALIAVTNGIALVGVAYNRSGAPDATLQLTQRELEPGWTHGDRDNSGLALHLRWRAMDAAAKDDRIYLYSLMGGANTPAWLDRDKMAALGFDVTLPDNPDTNARTFRRELTRDVLLVLEMDGPTYQRSLERATAAAERIKATGAADAVKQADVILQQERDTNSRLFAVDAGLDAAALRAKFPDRSRYAIVRGQVAPSFGQSTRAYAGYISAVNIEAINVPLELRPVFEGAAPLYVYNAKEAKKPAYGASVVFGRRLEPWISAAAKQ